MTALRKDRTLSGTLLISLFFHGILLVLLAGLAASQSTGKSVYLTEVTLLGEMPYGKGLGQKGDVSGNTGAKSGKTAAKPEKIASKTKPKKNGVTSGSVEIKTCFVCVPRHKIIIFTFKHNFT